MDIVKVGIVGVGNIGEHHSRNIYESPLCKLTAVCDIDPKAFKRVYAPAQAETKCFTDLDRFLAEGDMDLVNIAVPHYDHPSIAIKAMNAGKHIIVEKPIAVHKAAAEELIREGAKHPELVQSAMFCQREYNAHKVIKRLIDQGELGRITRLNWIITNWFRSQRYYDSGDWRASWRGEGGGVLLNQCPHQLDLMQWFFGMPCKVRAAVKFGKYHDIEVEDEVNAYLEYPDGAVGNFIASTGEMPGTNRLEITAEKGRLVYENGVLEFLRNEQETSVFCRNTESSFGALQPWKCTIPYEPDTISIHRLILENVARAILHGEKLIAPMAEGIRGLELGNAMLLSGWKDCDITLPIDGADFEERLNKLIATSRYQKKTVAAEVDENSMQKSFGNK
ncbi:MAG: Gfo/Idh/MocA family oxidoreductase [Lentisphaeria bacterium]|nr:Gfo/Idh/MocA family oxidoreductase [Lentisphaeria bacterium]